ncbi:hypothetical protein BJX62DRAFT_187375 [Aspergillus germanicus]
MDQQPKSPSRPSGIPRLVSRIPLPTSTSSPSLRPSPSRDRLRADPGLKAARLRRPSEEPEFKKPLPKTSPPKKIQNDHQQKRVFSVAGTSDGPGLENEKLLEVDGGIPTLDVECRGRIRPSLSERTIETLAQIPPSPASSRRPSNAYNATSPMRSPSRPPSSMTSYSRSPSRSSSSRQLSGSDFLSGPPTAIRLPSRSRPSLSTNGSASEHSSVATADSSPKLRKPMMRRSIYGGFGPTPAVSESHASLNQAVGKPSGAETATPQSALQVKKTRRIQPKSSNSKLYSAASRSPAVKPALDLTSQLSPEVEEKKVSKSSSALRESIAKAKAARKATAQKGPQTQSLGAWAETDIQDPFNQQPKDQNHGLLRKRLEAGRTSGHLNIAAMSLTTFPEEVLKMYDFDPNAGTDWYESVDLVKFIAADNDFTELPDAAFPDIDPNQIDFDSEEEKGNQFGGLEFLDFHGNLLQSLPLGFRRLQRLHTLNLSNNKLSTNDIQVITEMSSLRDLKLAKNQLTGALLDDIGRLTDLEALDLHENSLTELPETLTDLKSLRILNLGHNQFTTLPFEILHELPLREIIAPKNNIKGTLIPASVKKLDALQTLDVVGNAIVKLAESESLQLPALQTLAISMNRIKDLPDVSSWQELLTLSAEDNSISGLPLGFTDLKKVRNVDLTGNDLSKLDEKIGLMDSLVSFRIANNPLRERKFLGMAVEDIKRDLRSRCEPEPQETDDEEGSVATQFTLAPESPAHSSSGWQLKPGGVLDRSYTELQDFEVDKLEHIKTSDVKYLYLQHNELRFFPTPALSMLALNLTDLDLSHNPLDSSRLFPSAVELPSLQTLSLSATGLVTLEPIMARLTAPSLTFLDVSSNSLSGSVPHVRPAYPRLTTFLAAENQFDTLEFEVVQGLQVFDVGNNNISALPPKLGLLRGEGNSVNWGGGSALRRFEVAGNSFRVPRWQIVAKGTDAILEWLKDRIPIEELREYEDE